MKRFVLLTVSIVALTAAVAAPAHALSDRFDDARQETINRLSDRFNDARQETINRLSDRFNDARQETINR